MSTLDIWHITHWHVYIYIYTYIYIYDTYNGLVKHTTQKSSFSKSTWKCKRNILKWKSFYAQLYETYVLYILLYFYLLCVQLQIQFFMLYISIYNEAVLRSGITAKTGLLESLYRSAEFLKVLFFLKKKLF